MGKGTDISSLSHHQSKNVIELPIYAVYLIGFTILFMLLAIIGLALALYLAIKKKQMFGLNFSKKEFVRQESTGVATLRNDIYEEHDKNNGSTLTMNSGIIEVNRVSDPETPIRTEDSKIMFTKRPLKPILPVMHRGQMEAICREVLRKVQKSDSASFRDLNELLNGKSEETFGIKPEAIIETDKEKNNELITEKKNHLQFKIKPNPKPDTKDDTQDEIKPKVETNDMLSEIKTELKSVGTNDVKIEVDHVNENISAEDSEAETEYDTVPSPVRYRHSGGTEDFELCDIPVYDLLPRRSYDGKNRNVIQLDQDSQYLLPISADQSEYVNCKSNTARHSYNSS